MSDQIELNLSSSALKHAGCPLRLDRVIRLGYKEKAMPARMIYGIAGHKFISTMYMTKGHIPTAREEALKVFNSIPRIDDRKSMHMSDSNHMLGVALWTWELCVKKDTKFEVIDLNGVPAIEVNYSIPFYEDEYVKINWCGTLDRLGKMVNGIHIIPDWKFTSSWSEKDYFTQYEMKAAPRGYVLALHIMAERYPDTILGKIGACTIGTRFDGIFVKPAINEVKFARSDVKVWMKDDQEIDEFRTLLTDKCKEISQYTKTGYLPRLGLINDSCEGKWGKCMFWNVCKSPDIIGDILLKRDFDIKQFNPLAYND